MVKKYFSEKLMVKECFSEKLFTTDADIHIWYIYKAFCACECSFGPWAVMIHGVPVKTYNALQNHIIVLLTEDLTVFLLSINQI